MGIITTDKKENSIVDIMPSNEPLEQIHIRFLWQHIVNVFGFNKQQFCTARQKQFLYIN